MRKISYQIGYAMVIALGMALSGCSDFLSPSPESIYTTQTFYKSQKDFELAITAVYDAQQQVYDGQQGMLHFLEARCDNTNSVNTNLYDDGGASFTDNSSCTPTLNVWKAMYQIITRTNGILDRIDAVEFSNAQTKDYIKGEAYGMRGWAYEMLGKYFGGVPLLTREMTEAEIRKVARSTQEQTFAQAVSDYKQAISLLPSSWSSDNAGRMTRGAANAVLGRLYMFMKQPAEARPYLEAVINSGIYQLADSYEKIFNDAYDNDPSADRVWEVQYIGGMMGEGQDYSEMMMPEDCGITEGYAVRGTSAAMQVSTDLLNSFEPGDYRRTWSTSNTISGSLAQGYTWCTKFCRSHTYIPQEGDDWAVNLPIIRYTDVILLEAEAINATEGPTATAIDYVNRVRARAKLPELTGSQTASKEAFLKVIKQERRAEFLFEGQRWFDLVRWGDFVSTMSAFFSQSDEGAGRYVKYVTNDRAIFAIPQSEIDRYDDSAIMPQNHGY